MRNQRTRFYLVIIVALLLGLGVGQAFSFRLAYVAALILAFSLLWMWLSVRGIGINRRTSARRAQVGGKLSESFAIRNLSLLPKVPLEVRDMSDLPGHRAGHVVPLLGWRGVYRWYVETLCVARGEYRLGPLSIGVIDPFGAFPFKRTLGATSSVIVYPQTVPVRRFELPMGILPGGEAQRRRTNAVTTNIIGVRDYAPGDSFNRIHWLTTVRRGELMVKKFEVAPKNHTWLFVDFSPNALVEHPSMRLPMNALAGQVPSAVPALPIGTIPPSTEEYAVVIAASLAKYFVDSNLSVGFAAYVPRREVYQPDTSNRHLLRILSALAVARSQTDHTLTQILARETPYIARGTSLVIITSSLDTSWIREARMVARRGIRPLCVLIDPSSFGGFTPVDDTRTLLRRVGIPHILIRNGDDLTAALAQRAL